MSHSEFLERISSHLKEKLPLVAYRKPGQAALKAVLQSDDRLHALKSFTDSGFVMAPFDSDGVTILLKPDKILETSGLTVSGESDITERYPSSSDNNFSSLTDEPSPSVTDPPAPQEKFAYRQLVAKAIEEISAGSFRKVVLSRCLEVDSNMAPSILFQRLLLQYSQAFCYLWYHPKRGLWMGATPEILLKMRHRQLTTMSLAGTQNYDGSTQVTWGKKELEEQELVTEYILNALEDQVSQLRHSPTETVRAGQLLHLRTTVTGIVEAGSFDGIVRSLHPTPAVCGLPKKEALDFIVENENYHREYYTGFLGELNLNTEKRRNSNRKNQENQAYRSVAKATTLFVNLRCMKLKDKRAFIYVGGGITKDSDAEREWEETVEKSKTMLSILYPRP